MAKSDLTGKAFDTSKIQVLVSKRRYHPRMGVILKNSILFLDYKSFSSYRIKRGNLCFEKGLFALPGSTELDYDYLDSYFRRNNDNPYALYHLINCICLDRGTTDLVDFPPLRVDYQGPEQRTAAIETLLQKAKLGDSVFSRPLEPSSFSSAIRKCDKTPFSHMGTYVGKGMTVDAGLDGVTCNDLQETALSNHIALYTFRQPMPDEKKNEMAARMIAESQKPTAYNYKGVFRVFLARQFRLPIKHAASIGDLLYSKNFDLVAYV